MSKRIALVLPTLLIALAHAPEAGAGPLHHAPHPAGARFHAPAMSTGSKAAPKFTQHVATPSRTPGLAMSRAAGRAAGAMAAANPFFVGAMAAMSWWKPFPILPTFGWTPMGMSMGAW